MSNVGMMISRQHAIQLYQITTIISLKSAVMHQDIKILKWQVNVTHYSVGGY